MLSWIKLGKLFDSSTLTSRGLLGFSQSPQAIVRLDTIDVFFSYRMQDRSGLPVSKVGVVTFDHNFNQLNEPNLDIAPLGELGAFDEHGIFPFSPVEIAGELYAFTCGWSRRKDVPVETATGLQKYNGEKGEWTRIARGPVLSATLFEPFLVGDSFVLEDDGLLRMWYIYGTAWMPEKIDEPVQRVYKIGYAESEDMYTWTKRDHSMGQLIPDSRPNECQALPSVVKVENGYIMAFCHRHAEGFRKDVSKGYSVGVAVSNDGFKWRRQQDPFSLSGDENEWDGVMNCYPSLFKLGDRVYMLYNGNEFGKNGFGLAVMNNA